MNKLSIERLKEISVADDGFLGRGEGKAMADELIATREMKGDQVPHGYIDPNAETGGMWVKTRAREGDQFTAPIFTAPQKPVVSELISMLKSEIVHAESNDIRLPKRLGEKVGRVAIPVDYLKAAIEAAGGIVKGGE